MRLLGDRYNGGWVYFEEGWWTYTRGGLTVVVPFHPGGSLKTAQFNCLCVHSILAREA